jgi:hypothetical protein
MNKGIKAARGEYCLFLNSEDILINKNTLNKIFEEISSCPESDIYYSDCVSQDNIMYFSPKILSIEYFICGGTICHQDSLIKRELFLKHGFYMENLKIVSDWAFFLSEFWTRSSKFTYIKSPITLFDTNGISSTQIEKIRIEREFVIKDTFKELAPLLLDYTNYKSNLPQVVYSNIQQRQGFGLKFILNCIKHWLFRNKNENHRIFQYDKAAR